MTTEKNTKPRGRPSVPVSEKKRRNFTFRGTDELHERLSSAAVESGRSISEEIELRLSLSFKEDEWRAHLDAQAKLTAEKLTEDFRKMLLGNFGAPKGTDDNAPKNDKENLGGLMDFKPEDSEQ